MGLVKSGNLVVRFLLELCALAALAYWGRQRDFTLPYGFSWLSACRSQPPSYGGSLSLPVRHSKSAQSHGSASNCLYSRQQ
jgi:hypothetical protein